jgi:hypothetical protein
MTTKVMAVAATKAMIVIRMIDTKAMIIIYFLTIDVPCFLLYRFFQSLKPYFSDQHQTSNTSYILYCSNTYLACLLSYSIALELLQLRPVLTHPLHQFILLFHSSDLA